MIIIYYSIAIIITLAFLLSLLLVCHGLAKKDNVKLKWPRIIVAVIVLALLIMYILDNYANKTPVLFTV